MRDKIRTTILRTLQRHEVTYVVEALCYKPEVRGFDSRQGHWIFKLT
jgi:hypothetical protein